MATVLCIEDEVDLLEDISEELQDGGYETYLASDGVEGLQMILRHKPDIVVSDISMPRMNGHQLVRKLREEHSEFSYMPFIFLTALTDRKDEVDGLKIGADDYLTKPVDYELLQITVASALRQAGRMIERKQEEQAKLYKALAKQESESAVEPAVHLPKHKFILVGASDPGLWTTQRQLEELGQDVRVFTSGRSFLGKADQFEVDIVVLWLHSDDMQAPMIAALNKSRAPKTVVALPHSLRGPMAEMAMNGVHDIVMLPLTKGELASKIESWIAV